MKRSSWFIGGSAALVSAVALAVTLNGKWDAPTTNTDGSSISAPLTYNVYAGPSGAETLSQTGVTSTAATLTAAAGTTTCFQVSAVANGVESDRTPEVCKTEPFPKPNAPTNFTLQ